MTSPINLRDNSYTKHLDCKIQINCCAVLYKFKFMKSYLFAKSKKNHAMTELTIHSGNSSQKSPGIPLLLIVEYKPNKEKNRAERYRFDYCYIYSN